MNLLLQSPREQHFLLSDVDWRTYVAFGDLLGERPVRLTYDRGSMELMTLSRAHERVKHLLVLLLAVLAEELGIEMDGGGSMTFRKEAAGRGLEPDECYWIQNEARVRGKAEIDLAVDPPPDLAIEIEISRSVLNRLAIYAELRVAEVWRHDGEALHVLLLGADGQYSESAHSHALPFLAAADLNQFLGQRDTLSNTALVRAFRQWVRDRVAAGWR